MKTDYYTAQTNEEFLASILDRVIEEQWRRHVAYWDNEEVKVYG